MEWSVPSALVQLQLESLNTLENINLGSIPNHCETSHFNTVIPSASQYPCRSWSKLPDVLEFWVYNFPGTSTNLKYLNKVHCHPQGLLIKMVLEYWMGIIKAAEITNMIVRGKRETTVKAPHTPHNESHLTTISWKHLPLFWKALLHFGFYPPSPVLPQPPVHSL